MQSMWSHQRLWDSIQRLWKSLRNGGARTFPMPRFSQLMRPEMRPFLVEPMLQHTNCTTYSNSVMVFFYLQLIDNERPSSKGKYLFYPFRWPSCDQASVKILMTNWCTWMAKVSRCCSTMGSAGSWVDKHLVTLDYYSVVWSTPQTVIDLLV